MDDCVFCKILAGDIPSEFIYDDDKCVAFRDINPKAATHVLIVPRKHIPTIAEMDDADSEIVGHMVLCARNIAKDLGLKGYNLQFNVGKDGGQEVFHIHLHLLSKFS